LILFIRELVGRLRLGSTYLDAFLLYHDKAGIDPLNFVYQLLLADRPVLRLVEHLDLLVGRDLIE